MKTKILYVGMKYDYGNKQRGLSFEYRNFQLSLQSYCRKNDWEFLSYDFMQRGMEIGLDSMTAELLACCRRERPDYLFAVLFDFHRDPRHDVFKHISALGIKTIHWFCDDHWRFEKYSSVIAPNFDFICTTANSALPKYNQMGIASKVIKSQWACNHELYIPYNIPKDIEVSFVGQPHGDREPIIRHLIATGFNVEYFGFNWKERPRLPFHQMVRLFSRSKINLNLSNSSNMEGQQIKGRNFEIPGTNSFVLTGRAENLEEYYENGKEIVIFESVPELIELTRYFLEHDTERRRIAENAYQRTISEHTWFHRYDKIFEYAKSSGSNKVTKNIWWQPKDISPAFSIIMANYNGGKYIDLAISSVLQQTFTDWELIIVDDASTDDSITKIEKYLDDKRIRLIRHESNQKYISALITGISRVKAPIFGTLDSDDALTPDAVEIMYSAHIKNPDAGFIYSQFVYCDENLKPTHIGYCNNIPWGRTNIDSDCVSHFRTCKLDFYKKTPGYDISILHAEDKDISYKLEEAGEMVYVDKPLYLYRVLPGSISHIKENRELSLDSMRTAKINAINRRKNKAHEKCKAAFAKYKKAADEFDKRKFKAAEALIDEYKKLVDFSAFPKHDFRERHEPLISVIIVAYKTSAMLIDCVNSVLNQQSADAEIIVVDNGGNENVVPALIASKLLYVAVPVNVMPAEGRNIGAYFARGKVLYFLDDDALLQPGSLAALADVFRVPEVLVARGKILPKKKIESAVIPGHYDLGDERLIISYADVEGNSAYRKQTYNEVGGQNPLLFGGEGFELCYRVNNKFGFGKIVYDPAIVIQHDYADTGDKLKVKTGRHEKMRAYQQYLHTDIEVFRHIRIEKTDGAMPPLQLLEVLTKQMVAAVNSEKYSNALEMVEKILELEKTGSVQFPLEQREHFKKLAEKFRQILK